MSRRSWPVTRFVSSATRSGRSWKRLSGAGTVTPSRRATTVAACCSARTSVGAMNAPWWPPWTATSSVLTATTVLPDPTSPWRSRCIGCGPARSCSISAITARWSSVSANGQPLVEARRPARPRRRGGCPWRRAPAPSCAGRATSWTRSSSSKARRRRASSFSAIESGAWMPNSARCRSTRPKRRRAGSGTGSAMPRARQRSRALSTQPAISQVLRSAFSLWG